MRKSTKKGTTGGQPAVDPRFAPIVQAFAKIREVSAGKLFASYGLKVKGKIFAMFGRSQFVVKLPKERVDELVSAGKGKRFEPGTGRVMKEWVAFESGDAEWKGLAEEAYQFVRQSK